MLKTRFIQFLALLISLSFFAGGNALADNGYGKQKVVYHINYDDPKKQAGGLKNIQNHINAVGAKNLDIKVVLHGHGLSLLLDPESLSKLKKFKHANADEKMMARVDSLKDQGVSFNVCNNTIRGRKVDLEGDLYNVEKSDVVPSGVAEVAKLQLMGYAYIKP